MDKETPIIIEGQRLVDLDGQECVIAPPHGVAPVFTVEARPHPTLGHTLDLTPADFRQFAVAAAAFWRKRERARSN